MSEKYVFYTNTSDMNRINSVNHVDENNLNRLLSVIGSPSYIKVDESFNVTFPDYYVLSGTLALREELETFIVPATISGVTTVSGNNVGLATISGISVGSTINVWESGYVLGAPYSGRYYSFEMESDSVFETTFDMSGDYVIEVVPSGVQYKNSIYTIKVI